MEFKGRKEFRDYVFDNVTITKNLIVAAGANFSFSGFTIIQMNITAASNQIVLGPGPTTTISATTPTVSRIYTLPDTGANSSFVMTDSSQIINGSKTFSSAITITPTTNQIVLGTTNTITLNSVAPSASRVLTFPDPTTNGNIAYNCIDNAFNTGQTISSTKSIQNISSGSLIISGVASVLTSPGTQISNSNTETDLYIGSTAIPTLTTLSTFLGMPVAANTWSSGRVARIKCSGLYANSATSGAITVNLYYNTSSSSTKIGTGTQSSNAPSNGTFIFIIDLVLVMLSSTNILCNGALFLSQQNSSGVTSYLISSGLSGVAITTNVVSNLHLSWTFSVANAGNTAQLLTSNFEFLN